jgi:hypothetical protein
VTTVRTTASVEPYADLNLKRWIDEGKILGPKMHVTGPYLEGRGNFRLAVPELTGPEDARKTVEFWAARGVTSFKAFMHITRAELAAALQAAHERGLKVTGHLCSVTFHEAAKLGIDNVEHGFAVATEFDPDKQPDVCPVSYTKAQAVVWKLSPESPRIQDLFRTLISRNVAVTSTLVPFDPALQVPERVLDVLSPQSQAGCLRQRIQSGPRAGEFQRETQLEVAFVRAGGTLLAGPDPTGIGCTVAGFGDHRQLELMVQGGFTPVEAIQIATLNGARYLGEQDRIGSLVPGKQADLIVVRGDPSARIDDIEHVELVFKDGIGYDSAKLIESVRGLVGLR